MAAIERIRFKLTSDTKGFTKPIKAAGLLVFSAFAAAVKVTAEFEKELSKLRAISGGTEKQMKALEKESRRLGESTTFTAKEVASLQVELAKLGFTTDDILNASGGVLALASGLQTTLADAAVLTGSALRSFGLTTEETGRVVDVFAKAAASSALDFTKLTESLKIAAPIANATNTTIEDTVAILGTLANAGLSGSLAGTALRKIFTELNGSGLSLNDAYEQINTSSNKLATATELVGKRAGGALLIMADGIQPTNDLATALYNADGAALAMQKTMEDNLIGDLLKLKSAITEVGIELGGTTDGSLRDFTQGLTELITGSEEVLGIFDQWELALNTISLLFFKSALAYKEFQNSFPSFDNSGLLKDIANLKEIIRLQEAVGLAIVNRGLGIDHRDPDSGGGGGVPSGPTIVPGSTGLTSRDVSSSSSSTGPGVGFSHDFGGINASAIGSTALQEEIDAALAAYDMYLGGVQQKNKLIEDSFSNLGQNIANSLGATEGVFGAFVGTLIQGLIQLAAQQLTSAAVTTATSSVKVAAHSTVATAAAVAGAAESAAATGPAAIATLPIFIGAALAAVAAALSGVKGAKTSGGGGAGSAASPGRGSAPALKSVQGEGFGSGALVAQIDGQDLRFVLQAADDNYDGLN